MKKLVVLALLICCIVFYACRHEVPAFQYEGSSFCFSDDILPIFINKCATAGCHDEVTKAGGYQLDSYSHIILKGVIPGYATNSVLFTSLNYLPITDMVHHMPVSGHPQLTEIEKRYIGTWINEGVQKTECACDSSQFDYKNSITPITRICVVCHKGKDPPDSINLETYEGVKAIALNGLLLKVVNHDPSVDSMPKNLPKLSACRIAQLRKWVAAGAPFN